MSEKPYLTIISSNLSGNRLGRALVHSECLKDKYRIRIVGMLKKGHVIWKTGADSSDIELVPIKYFPPPFYIISIIQLLLNIRGKSIIAVKPLFSSFGIGLIAKSLLKKKLILDIDDDELAFLSEGKSFSQKYFNLHPDKYVITRLLHNIIRNADEILVSNYEIRKRYGGIVIPHARDSKKLNPPADKVELKRRLNIIPDKFVIAHVGSYRPHKGLERIVEAMEFLSKDEYLFLYTANTDFITIKPNIKRLEEFRFDELPVVLGACDLMLFPLEDNLKSRSQLPAKLVDAMMAGIPFLISASPSVAGFVTDRDYLLPFYIGAEELASRIIEVRRNYKIYKAKSEQMKNEAEGYFSVDIVGQNLKEVIERCG